MQKKIIDDFEASRNKKRSGQECGYARNAPLKAREIAAPIKRAIPVTPEAAERSSGINPPCCRTGV